MIEWTKKQTETETEQRNKQKQNKETNRIRTKKQTETEQRNKQSNKNYSCKNIDLRKYTHKMYNKPSTVTYNYWF
jgi:hypothetical protein